MITDRDTIPRSTHVAYFHSALAGIAAGENFDTLRGRIRQASSDLSRRQGDGLIASRVADEFTSWSPTKDTISELMLLGLVERRSLPSRRIHVEAHRETTYTLTSLGQEIFSRSGENFSALAGELTPLLIQQHPYLSSLCTALSKEPLLLPEYTDADLKVFRQDAGSPVDKLAANAAERIALAGPHSVTSREQVAKQVRLALGRRFPPGAEPTSKGLLATINDALAVATLQARGLRFDAVTLDILTSWGRQLFIFDESRYVQDRPGRSIWATADVTAVKSRILVSRRGLSAYGDAVATELAAAYREIATAMSETMGGHPVKHPYIDIFKVRALAAFRLRVSTALVDHVIAEIFKRERATSFIIEPQLGNCTWPSSEVPFMLNARRYYVMLIKSEGEEP